MKTSIKFSSEQLIPCCYVNGTNSSKIIRISEPYQPHLEKVVFPGSKIYFQAQPEAFLEVNGNEMISSIIEDRIACNQLKIESN